MVVLYFTNLYTDDATPLETNLETTSGFPSLSGNALVEFQDEVTNDDIKNAIISMEPSKSSGSDGVHVTFFQNSWDTVGETICNFVKSCFSDSNIIESVNDTVLVLIPKVKALESIRKLRPISLCNIIFKIITKIIALRLKNYMDFMVSHSQSSVAQEVLHFMERKKGNKGQMAIKVDLEKTYD